MYRTTTIWHNAYGGIIWYNQYGGILVLALQQYDSHKP